MKILLSGGTGFIGTPLREKLIQEGHQVSLLTRQTSIPFSDPLEILSWDGVNLQKHSDAIQKMDAVINLSGEGITNKRWTKAQKEKIKESRVQSTRAIVRILRASNRPSRTLINASAVGFYGPVENGEITETSNKGNGFLADVCEAWEKEANDANKAGVRVITLRIGVVLEKGGGAVSKILPPFLFYMGGPLGSGNQWFPWIHREDVIGILYYCLTRPNISGPVNATAPHPVNMKDFSRSFGKAIGRPSWAPVPGFMLKLLLGEMSEMLLTGQKAIPAKILDAGYSFKYPYLDAALEAIFKK